MLVIACVVRSQKRDVDSTRGNYVSANNRCFKVAFIWPPFLVGGTLIVAAVGVLLLYKRGNLWYKKIDTGFVVVPVCVPFIDWSFVFFSSRSARLHGGRFYYSAMVRLPCAWWPSW